MILFIKKSSSAVQKALEDGTVKLLTIIGKTAREWEFRNFLFYFFLLEQKNSLKRIGARE